MSEQKYIITPKGYEFLTSDIPIIDNALEYILILSKNRYMTKENYINDFKLPIVGSGESSISLRDLFNLIIEKIDKYLEICVNRELLRVE